MRLARVNGTGRIRLSRFIALACAIVLAAGGLAVDGGQAALARSVEGDRLDRTAGPAGGQLDRAPLVYVGPEGSGLRLLERLRAAGRVLEVVAAGDGDYVVEAAEVAEAVRRAGAAGRGGRVDVVAVGQAGLAARLATLMMDEPVAVRTLVMVAPPNRGSFAATALRLAAQLENQVAVRATLGRLPPGERPIEPEPLDETAYVATRAMTIYEPLAARYYREKFGPAPGAPDFLTWLARTEKGLFAEAIVGAQIPPAMDRYPALPELVGRPPEVDESLTRAFFEIEAVRAAEYNCARLFVKKAPLDLKDLGLAEALARVRTGGLKRVILDVLADLLKGLGLRAMAERLPQVEGQVAARLLGFDAWALPAARLTTEECVLPAAVAESDGSDHEKQVILANYFLKFWNDREAARRLALETTAIHETAAGPPDPRYVIIAPKWPNLWAGLPGLGGSVRPTPNDLRTELRAMSLPVREDDAFVVVRGAPSLDPGSLLERRDVQDLILDELGGRPKPRIVLPRDRNVPGGQGWKASGRLETFANRSSHLEVRGDLLAGSGRLVVELSPPTRREPGFVLTSWAYAEGADGATVRTELGEVGSAGLLAADFGDFGGECRRVLIGLRFVPEPGLERVVDPGARAAAQVAYRLTFVPEDEDSGDVGSGVRPGKDDSGQDGTHSAGGAPPPTIMVVRRSKKTTHRVERRTVHRRWEWDFGDGTGMEDGDPTHTEVTVSHGYPPGRYRVTARSIDESGLLIRQLSWDVSVPGEADGTGRGNEVPREFRAETIREPRVKVVIDGPKMWVTGKPAEFRVTAEVDDPPFSDGKLVSIDPGPVFNVVWARPGTFEVSAAVTVRLSYRFPERSVFVVDTYLEKVEVQVCATAATE